MITVIGSEINVPTLCLGESKTKFQYYSAIRKDKMRPSAATWMQLGILIVSEGSLKEKDKYHDIMCVWNLRQGTDDPTHETETDGGHGEGRPVFAGGGGEGG